ncbi:hypothetical protein COV20_03975 [Candidatus Woesearchaeota archaeon CG10_big_fil_rev_8_21_14_0_10_45_16]|nr:MAG: hypothetical protein COV20_03975 [Candidatus Woesearchaeota archaeon CG10_big_fil_rev_8_21_14_0_10_45_16]
MTTTTKLVSSDLNGTLVHQHTMSDMIRIYLGQENFEKANAVFKKQTSGEASMEAAFGNAGPLTRGLTLRQALEYTRDHMRFVDGFQPFVDELADRQTPFIINSTGYSVTIHAIRAQLGRDKIAGQIGNRLEFGQDADPQAVLREDELENLVFDYFASGKTTDRAYDRIKATGVVHLGIVDEAAKASLLLDRVAAEFPGINPTEIVHIGDTYGDFGGISGIAKAGGTGIAFNYNGILETKLKEEIAQDLSLGALIHFVDPKGPDCDMRRVLPIVYK